MSEDIAAILKNLVEAKAKEKEWSKYRVHCEGLLVDALGKPKAGKSDSWTFDEYKVTIKQPVTHPMSDKDIEFFQARCTTVPLKTKYVLCKKTYDALPKDLRILPEKLGKIGVTLTEIEDK